MKTIFFDEPKKIAHISRKLRNILNVDIQIRDKEVSFDGLPEDEFIAEKVIDALNFGFPLQVALLIKEEDYIFQILSIKDYTHRKDLEPVRARIIGREGGTLRTLKDLTECYFEIKGNEIGIIGLPEYMENARKSIISLVQGSKQANVYSFLEKHHIEPILDLGLKEKKKKSKK